MIKKLMATSWIKRDQSSCLFELWGYSWDVVQLYLDWYMNIQRQTCWTCKLLRLYLFSADFYLCLVFYSESSHIIIRVPKILLTGPTSSGTSKNFIAVAVPSVSNSTSWRPRSWPTFPVQQLTSHLLTEHTLTMPSTTFNPTAIPNQNSSVAPASVDAPLHLRREYEVCWFLPGFYTQKSL